MHYSPPPPAFQPPPRLYWLARWILAIGGATVIVLLAVAAWLSPSPAGFGTHRQLGLPECSLRQLAGIRCPSCGMTTSWSYLMHGQPVAALRANTGGTLLGLVAIVAGPWMLVSGVRGRWLLGRPHEFVTLAIGLAIVATTLIDWTVRLTTGN
ncbi:MAG: DUF2752 domain-containing protein [Pirellulaceae bacterium]|nr:DUF2752 domain-containing protein [Pirellulaceae bacterium]